MNFRNYQYLIILQIALLLSGSLSAQHNGQGITNGIDIKSVINEKLLSQKNYRPFPKINDREGWSKANQQLLQKNLEEAEKILDYAWETIPATYALLPSQTGNRGPYESILNRKKSNLWKFAMAEVYENNGRFMNQIVNGIWSICEDTYWGNTTHLNLWRTGPGLPDVTDPFVDIYAAEMASTLAWVSYFLEDKLDNISPLINQRVYYEMNKRIFEPTMNHQHYWMGPSEFEPRPNNWNPWICANWLNAVLLLEKNEERRIEMVTQIIEVLDAFFIPFPNDGCSDEGPHYWKGAAGTFFEAASILDAATNGAINIYSNEKFKNMGRYIRRIGISENYAVNFSDAKHKIKYDGSLVYRYGVQIDDPKMIQMGAYYLQKQGVSLRASHGYNELSELFLDEEYKNIEGKLFYPKEFVFPDTEVFVARDKEGSIDGFFVAAKGGHNQESHNHNDLGNYIIYYNGEPVIVDLGSGTYTARTFSDQRYDIWFINSEYHNTPTINGVNQLKGSNFHADETKHSRGKVSSYGMNLSKAYPENAGINFWNRKISLHRGKYVDVSNQFELSEIKGKTYENIMVSSVPRVVSENRIELYNSKGDAFFAIEFDEKKLKPTIEKRDFSQPEDKGIKNSWGDNLYRIRMELIGNNRFEQYKIRFRFIQKN